MDAFEPTTMFPPAYDLVWSLVVVAHLVLVVAALWRFFRDRPQGVFALVGALLIIFIPLLGPALYLLAQRGENALQHQREREPAGQQPV